MAKKSDKKVYAVAVGRQPGIYNSWSECQAQVRGFNGSVFKSFRSTNEARAFLESHSKYSRREFNPFSKDNDKATCGVAADMRKESAPSSGETTIFLGPGVAERSRHAGKLYAVAVGHVPGIYASWRECQAQTNGYSRAVFKSFQSLDDAKNFIHCNRPSFSGEVIAAVNKRPRRDDATDLKHTSLPKTHQQSLPQTIPQTHQQTHQPPLQLQALLQITIFFDGGSRGNPGIAGAGASVMVAKTSHFSTQTNPNSNNNDSNSNFFIRTFCGDNKTNNYAEYKGLLSGLEKAEQILHEYCQTHSLKTTIMAESSSSFSSDQNDIIVNNNNDNNSSNDAPLSPPPKPLLQLQVYGDSNLIIQQLNGVYKCKNANISPLYKKCQSLIHEMKHTVLKGREHIPNKVSLDHVYRNKNTIADALANEAMDEKRSWTTTEPLQPFVKKEKNEKYAIQNENDEEYASC